MTYDEAHKVVSRNAWVRPSNYVGRDWIGWAVVIHKHRDSDLLDTHNYNTAVARMRVLDPTEGWQTAHESHWAVGTCTSLMVDLKDNACVIKAASIINALHSYPILDEDGFIEAEAQACAELWDGESEAQRKRWLHDLGITEDEQDRLVALPFEAFVSELSEYDDSGRVYDRIRCSL